ncbi:MAG: PmoA family protein [Candidatus Omnitrophica bacterium]|nr:PmoA family protein [Candidatus Omnitrophota bacterium]
MSGVSNSTRILLLPILLFLNQPFLFARADSPEVTFHQGEGEISIEIGGQPFARYVYVDTEIPRPYFCDVKTPSGIQATRNHPPIEGVDRTDHATYHPGIWLAFGDISGQDFWRLKARVRQERFVQDPVGESGHGSFSVENVYLGEDGSEVCRETVSYGIHAIPGDSAPLGYLLVQDSVFSSDKGSFVFGDQEEMGFAFRVATPMNVKEGGLILDSEGRRNQDEVWGKIAKWCDYSGTIDGNSVGMTLIPNPGNFKPSWFHARDYGVLLANPFGRKAYTGGEASAVEIKKGEEFRYRNGVFIYSTEERDDSMPEKGFQAYLNIAGE